MQNHLLIFFLAHFFHRLLSKTALDNNLVKFELDRLSPYDLFLDWILHNESIDVNFLFLPNSMRSIHSLQVDLWVIVRIEKHNMISCRQINAEATSTRTDKEHKLIAFLRRERSDPLFTFFKWHGAINATVAILTHH